MKLLQHRKWQKHQLPDTSKSPVFRENHRKRQTDYNEMLSYQKKKKSPTKEWFGKGTKLIPQAGSNRGKTCCEVFHFCDSLTIYRRNVT